jgi:hypothetical protein
LAVIRVWAPARLQHTENTRRAIRQLKRGR